MQQRLDEEYYTQLQTIVVAAPAGPAFGRRTPPAQHKRSLRGESLPHGSSAKRVRPTVNMLRPVNPFHVNMPKASPFVASPFVASPFVASPFVGWGLGATQRSPFPLEHVVSMES